MSKRNYIFKALLLVAVPFAGLAFSACSDEWDDHYNPDESQISGESLWQAIEGNPELSNFANVVKATGYDKALGGSQSFSVFAPVNDDFTAEQAQKLIDTYQKEKSAGTRNNDNSTIKEFIQNHIALYNHSVSTESTDSLTMMNGKYQVLSSNSFAGHNLLSKNQAYANGILYTIDGEASYLPNVFEYLNKDAELDSVAKFLYSYNKYEFDASKSVAGGIVDGKTVYLDSVVELQNDELHRYIGQLDSEDSAYWMVAPTNEVWNKYVPQYEKYFTYDKTISKHEADSLTWANARFALLRGVAFSRTLNTDASIRDSAMSTLAVGYDARYFYYGSYKAHYYQYNKPFEAGGVFNGTTNVTCSNGQVMKANHWNIKPTETFLQTQYLQGEDGDRIDSVDKATTNYPLTIRRVLSSNPYWIYVKDSKYAEITPTGSQNVKAYFSLPNLLSNVGYDIYVVTVPALAGDTLASDFERRPTKFRVYLRHQKEDGTMSDVESNWTLLDGKDNNSSLSQAVWTTTADKVNVFKIADNITVPYTTYGTGKAPKVELVFQTTPLNSEVNRRKTFNRILRIDEIIVVPHEN